ncbi:hypothetical protein M3T53_08685 [Actinomyces sp. B33]|uniref:hypothetical protein n=1 Tax=Actinomyces sp. B33 TaxID=2942131 RepID=UPI0023404708|nr:hypothetical protein [Actinomyces sp. B33]MDC4233777.1 hypothetical protein [Actinomyces sp. B33]
MTWGSILSEGWRDTVSGTSRALLWGVVTAAIVLTVIAAEILHAHAAALAAQEYAASGASIITLQAPGRIDPAACEALNRVEGVRAAGALAAEEERVRLAVLPSAPVPVATVTPSFPAVLGARTGARAGAVISDQVAERINAGPGDAVATDGDDLVVSGVYAYPEDGRASGYGYMILLPSNARTAYDECWVDAWPQSDLLTGLVYSSLIPTRDPQAASPRIGQLNSTLGARFTGREQFDARATRFSPAVVALACLALGFASVRARRLHLASDLHAGATRRDMRTIVVVETLWWLAPVMLLCESAAIILTAGLGELDDPAPLVLANRIVWAATAASLTGAALGWSLTRERHLFAYFTTR